MKAQNVVGLIPAAGSATRVAPLPCSKEIYPIGTRATADGPRPKAAIHYLLDGYRAAGIERAMVILRDGKWDIAGYLGSGDIAGIDLAYLAVDRTTPGVPWTLDRAYGFVGDAVVALGFPDIVFTPTDAYSHLLAELTRSEADVVLGLFPTAQAHKTDMVDTDDDGRVRRIVVKPKSSELRHTWSIAVWNAPFTRYLHQMTAGGGAHDSAGDHAPEAAPEIHVGTLLQRFIDDGGAVGSVAFAEGTYLDVGTPADLLRAQRELG